MNYLNLPPCNRTNKWTDGRKLIYLKNIERFRSLFQGATIFGIKYIFCTGVLHLALKICNNCWLLDPPLTVDITDDFVTYSSTVDITEEYMGLR